MTRRPALLVALAVAASLPVAVSRAQVPGPEDIPAARETEAVVLTGASFPTWAALGDVALKANSIEGTQCLAEEEGADVPDEFPDEIEEPLEEGANEVVGPALEAIPDSPITDDEPCSHSEYEDPDLQSSDFVPPANATPTDRLLGYRWNGAEFEQIPFQVDEMFVHYLSNDISGFAFYSETDQHTTYAFDREGFRWTDSHPDDPCLAQPRDEVAKDPVQGLDTDDELVFMARDAGAAAPSDAPLPPGIEGSYQVSVVDPTSGTQNFVYVMKATEDGPSAAFGADNGYVRYERDADSNVFLFSESSFENYGRAPAGPWFDPETGTCHSAESEWRQHRPGDQATITTPRYRFRYEGRWLMTELQISQDHSGDWTYGPDVIDQWKARAFQQRPGGETPCCGYEEEVNNWGGSSILMGELAGPVRAIRETWGADSGTNVVRREIFYRDEIRFISFLRVHVIPPADGIYSQWDYNAGIMTRYYNPLNPDGVAIDGCNDDKGNSRVYANRDGLAFDPDGQGPHPCGEEDQASIGREGTAGGDRIDNDIDVPDPVFSGLNAGMNWEQIAGPHGTLVSRYQLHKATPGSAHTVVTVPYYRDDACFDDGTGTNPGPHMDPRSVDDIERDGSGNVTEDHTVYVDENGETQPRTCWDHTTDPTPALSDPRYWQASIGTHGVHIELIADSDNAHTTVPITEIDGDQRVVILPGEQPNVGERYGRQPEKPLVVVAHPEDREPAPEPTESPTGSPTEEPTGSPTEEPTESPTEEPSTQPPGNGGGNNGGGNGSPTPTDGSPTPTSSPDAVRSSTLSFTDRSAAAGQYSDEAVVEARLTDSVSGDPLVGKEVRFELVGASDGRSFDSTTDARGIARVSPTLTEEPGSYQLVARFDGDAIHGASGDQSSFVVEKEDVRLSLRVRSGGRTYKRAIARLVDADSRAPVARALVIFEAGREAIARDRTDARGFARVRLARSVRRVTAAFAGSDHYNSARTRPRS